ncbi:MAG: hypothetical protein R2709_10885 [Marmoricola sp.]
MLIFLALFRLLNHAANGKAEGSPHRDGCGTSVQSPRSCAKIADSFTRADTINVQILAGVLVVAMTATTFITQRQLMAKNMPADAMTGPYAQQQKMLLLAAPACCVCGLASPSDRPVDLLDDVEYLTHGSAVLRDPGNNPAPGTPAFDAKRKRDSAKGKVTEDVPQADADEEQSEEKRPAQRQQPGSRAANNARSLAGTSQLRIDHEAIARTQERHDENQTEEVVETTVDDAEEASQGSRPSRRSA